MIRELKFCILIHHASERFDFTEFRLPSFAMCGNYKNLLSVSTVWKSETFTLTEIFFRQINSLVCNLFIETI